MLMLVITFFGLTLNSSSMVWVFMEVNLIMFLILLVFSVGRVKMMPFFLIQVFSSILFFLSFLMFFATSVLVWKILASFFLIWKMGIIPLHYWMISLVTKINWESMYYLMTIQKFLPLTLLSMTISKMIFLMAILSWVISGLSGLMTTMLKKVFLFSSLFFMGMITISLSSSIWVVYMAMYSMFSLPLFIFGSQETEKSGQANFFSYNTHTKLMFWLLFLNIGGVPPFPGFFLKMNFGCFLYQYSILILSLFLLSSVMIMYMYMESSLIGLSKKDFFSGSSLTISMVNLIFMFQLMTMSFWVLV